MKDRTLLVASLGTFLVLVVFTTPVAALAATAAGLHAGLDAQAWILSSMSLGLAAGLLASGAVADDFGRRRVFLAGCLVSAVAAVACAVSPGALPFVLARIVGGVGGAAVLASSLGLIGHAFPPGPERARATGWWGAAVGAGIAAGPLLAVGLTEAFDWRAVQWLTAVLAVLLAVAGRVSLVESRSDSPRPVDVAGVLLLGFGLAAVLAGLVEGRQSWASALVWALLLGGVVLLAGFTAVEARGRAPMLDLGLFRRPDFVAVNAAGLATGLGVIAAMSFLPTLVQRGLHHTATAAALLLLGWSGTSVVTALLARRLPATVSNRSRLAAGLAGVAVGQLLLYGVGAGTSIPRLLPGVVVAGLASGVLNAALGAGAVASVPPGRASMGSGANNTARYVGSAVGVTIVAVVATRPAALTSGWNAAVLVTAAFSLVGAVAVLATRTKVSAAAGS